MFFEGLGVQYGSKIEENSLKMTMLAPRWAVLGDFGVILRLVGGKMVTKSARMSQHRRAKERILEDFKVRLGLRMGRTPWRSSLARRTGRTPWQSSLDVPCACGFDMGLTFLVRAGLMVSAGLTSVRVHWLGPPNSFFEWFEYFWTIQKNWTIQTFWMGIPHSNLLNSLNHSNFLNPLAFGTPRHRAWRQGGSSIFELQSFEGSWKFPDMCM